MYRQLELMNSILTSILTESYISRQLSNEPSTDLQLFLTDTHDLLNSVIDDRLDGYPMIWLHAIPILPLDPRIGHQAYQFIKTIIERQSSNFLLYFLILSDNHIVISYRGNESNLKDLHPLDFYILIHWMNWLKKTHNTTTKDIDNWVPICLPKLDASNFIHLHCCSISINGNDLDLVFLNRHIDKSQETFMLKRTLLETFQSSSDHHHPSVFHHLQTSLMNHQFPSWIIGNQNLHPILDIFIHGLIKFCHFKRYFRLSCQNENDVSLWKWSLHIYEKLHDDLYRSRMNYITSKTKDYFVICQCTDTFEIYLTCHLISPIHRISSAIVKFLQWLDVHQRYFLMTI
jgi:hypothetical protein